MCAIEVEETTFRPQRISVLLDIYKSLAVSKERLLCCSARYNYEWKLIRDHRNCICESACGYGTSIGLDPSRTISLTTWRMTLASGTLFEPYPETGTSPLTVTTFRVDNNRGAWTVESWKGSMIKNEAVSYDVGDWKMLGLHAAIASYNALRFSASIWRAITILLCPLISTLEPILGPIADLDFTLPALKTPTSFSIPCSLESTPNKAAHHRSTNSNTRRFHGNRVERRRHVQQRGLLWPQ